MISTNQSIFTIRKQLAEHQHPNRETPFDLRIWSTYDGRYVT